METETTSVATEKPPTREAVPADVRHDWGRAEVEAIYRTALPELVFRAQTVHRERHAADRVHTCQLISIKPGGCPEDCAYCPQSAHCDTVRPPTVPPGSARLRFSLTRGISDDELLRLGNSLNSWHEKLHPSTAVARA